MKRGRVLLADGHLGMLGGIHSLLDALFDSVLMVADERSLIDAIATFAPDLVVVDLSLPGSEEANVANRLKSQFPDLRIIVLSVHDEATVVRQLLQAAAGFVLKRTAATDLVPAVEEVLRGGAYVSPALRHQLAETAPEGDKRSS
jgi:DNA-binding NarL/FixJ family response regulator